LEKKVDETRTIVSSVNGIEMEMPRVIDNSRDATHDGLTQQEKLDSRFTGRNGTEGGKMFLTLSDHAAMVKEESAIELRSSGSTISFGVPSSPDIEFEADRKKREAKERMANARAAKNQAAEV
jgi:hypothetical protein